MNRLSLILILSLFTSQSIAQHKINLYFRGEAVLFSYKVDNESRTTFTKYPVIQSFSFAIDGLIFSDFILELRTGYKIAKDSYEGFELGGFLIYKFAPFFINSGINFHFNRNQDGNSGGDGETVSLLGWGFGYKFSKNFGFEISYFLPLHNEYGIYDGKIYKVNNIFNFGFVLRIK